MASDIGAPIGPVIKDEQHMRDAALRLLKKNQNRWSWLDGFRDVHLQKLAAIIAKALWKEQVSSNRRLKRFRLTETFMGEGNLELYLPAQSRLYAPLVEPGQE